MSKIINLYNTQGKGKRVKQRHSHTSVRLNLTVEPEERESFKKIQELLGQFTEGSRVSASVLVRRMMNLYTAQIMEAFIEVQQQIEAGVLKESDQKDAIAKAMKPEIAALLRAGGHKMRKA
jgi:hypothetical protein